MVHDLGVLLSILGVILTSAGVIGVQRLEQLEQKIRRSMRRENFSSWSVQNRSRAEQWLRSIGGRLPYAVIATGILLMLGIFLLRFYPGYLDPWQMDIVTNVAVSGPGLIAIPVILAILAPLFAYLVVWVIWLATLPYRVLDRFVERAELQSTLVLIGIVLSVIGIVLNR